MSVRRDDRGQLAEPWTDTNYEVLAILEEVATPDADGHRPNRTLAAYLADIYDALTASGWDPKDPQPGSVDSSSSPDGEQVPGGNGVDGSSPSPGGSPQTTNPGWKPSGDMETVLLPWFQHEPPPLNRHMVDRLHCAVYGYSMSHLATRETWDSLIALIRATDFGARPVPVSGWDPKDPQP